MGLIDRHKKPGGFRKLVNSLELTAPDKREKIIETLRPEDPAFIADVEKAIYKFDDFFTMTDMMICELISTFNEMKTVALALYKAPQEWQDKFTKNMPPKFAREFKEEYGMLAGVTMGQQMGARFKMIENGRMLQKEGRLMLKPYDSKYPEE